MTNTQKVLVGGLSFLGGVAITLLFQGKFQPPPTQACNPTTNDCLEVRVRVKNAAPDCDVDYETVNVRTVAASTTPDQIRWCVKSTASNQYFIHFTANSGNNSPFPSNDFLVNKNNYGTKTCSDFTSPATGKPTGPANPYVYEIHYNSPGGPACSDPMVILK